MCSNEPSVEPQAIPCQPFPSHVDNMPESSTCGEFNSASGSLDLRRQSELQRRLQTFRTLSADLCHLITFPLAEMPPLDRGQQGKRAAGDGKSHEAESPRKLLRRQGIGSGGLANDACPNSASQGCGWQSSKEASRRPGEKLRRGCSVELKRTSSGHYRWCPKADLVQIPSSNAKLSRLTSGSLQGRAPKDGAVDTQPGRKDNTSKPGGTGKNQRMSKAAKGQPSSGPQPDEPVVCRVACQSWAGRKSGFKKPNQDAYCFMRTDDRKSLLFGVFDGHGPNGQKVSAFVKEHLPSCLMLQPKLLSSPGEAFEAAFPMVNRELEPDVECSISGTTAVVAQVFGRRLTVAWAGDSRAVLGRRSADGQLESVALTTDHKPDHAIERQRITDSNGRVDRLVDHRGEEVGPYRVWLRQSPYLGLAMSRSLGDGLAHTIGVISQPEVHSRELRDEDLFLILATDGVWEWISNKEAVQIVGEAPSTEAGCKKLMQTARAKWQALDRGGYMDDITAMVIGFTHRQVPSEVDHCSQIEDQSRGPGPFTPVQPSTASSPESVSVQACPAAPCDANIVKLPCLPDSVAGCFKEPLALPQTIPPALATYPVEPGPSTSLVGRLNESVGLLTAISQSSDKLIANSVPHSFPAFLVVAPTPKEVSDGEAR